MTAATEAAPACTTPDEMLLGFARALRAAGVPVTQDRDPRLPRGGRAGRPRRPARRRTGPAGRRCAPAPTTSTATTRSSRPGSTPATGCPAPGRATAEPRPAVAELPADDAAAAPARPTTRCVRAHGQRRPRCCGTATSPTLAPAEKARLAGDVRDPAPAPAACARTARHRPGTAASVDASRTLRASAAPDGRARPRSPGGAAAPGRAGWCCWSTCPAR